MKREQTTEGLFSLVPEVASVVGETSRRVTRINQYIQDYG